MLRGRRLCVSVGVLDNPVLPSVSISHEDQPEREIRNKHIREKGYQWFQNFRKSVNAAVL